MSAAEAVEPRSMCEFCGRPIEWDELRGRPASAAGYCLGVHTCMQRQVLQGRDLSDALNEVPEHTRNLRRRSELRDDCEPADALRWEWNHE